MAKQNISKTEKDGTIHGCIIEDEDPMGQAACYLQLPGGKRVIKNYKTDLSGDTLKTMPQGELNTPDGSAAPDLDQRLDDLTSKRLPYFQKLVEIEKSREG